MTDYGWKGNIKTEVWLIFTKVTGFWLTQLSASCLHNHVLLSGCPHFISQYTEAQKAELMSQSSRSNPGPHL